MPPHPHSAIYKDKVPSLITIFPHNYTVTMKACSANQHKHVTYSFLFSGCHFLQCDLQTDKQTTMSLHSQHYTVFT